MGERELVSVVVPAHNAGTTLAECLEACLAQTYPEFEVIVVDDGSTDDTRGIAEGFPVRYVRQDQRGPASARNRGASEANGAFVAFVDADCIPEPDWLDRLVAGFGDGVVAVGGTYGIANEESRLARMIHEEIALRHDGFGEVVDFLGSFNVAYRKEAFDAVGGFDEDFTMASGEDNDLAYRLAEHGELRFVREAVVAHYHPAQLWPYLKTQMWHGFWRVKLYRKHPRRSGKGDRYAGTGDLAAPGLLVAIVAGIALEVFGVATQSMTRGVATALSGFLIMLVTTYVVLRLSLGVRLVRRSGDRSMLTFADAALLRDVARALGMLRGFWHFIVCRRTTL